MPKKKAPKAVSAKKKVSAPKKAVAKPAAKKAVVKPAPKKPVAKAAPKKTSTTTAKKAAPKASSKKVVEKKTKTTASKPVVKTALKSAPIKQDNVKKPIATATQSAVKASTAKTNVSRITPIKAPVVVVAKPKTSTKSEMTLPIVPPNYEPTDKEEFMNPVMKEYYRQRLLAWRDELLRESEGTLHVLQEEGNMQKPDITDRASEETDLAIEFRTRDRERKLLNKINEALGRIEDNSYGYCEETGDPIPVKRLTARPTATRTLEAEELHERRERTQRDQYE